MARRIASTEVLRYSRTPAPRSTVRRKYMTWRLEQGIPNRCDNSDCPFHLGSLNWNGSPLPVILDHVNGNNRDNNPSNLRYLCPNCDSQQFTRGGANRSRVERLGDGSYIIKQRSGTRQYYFFPEPAGMRISGHAPSGFVRAK